MDLCCQPTEKTSKIEGCILRIFYSQPRTSIAFSPIAFCMRDLSFGSSHSFQNLFAIMNFNYAAFLVALAVGEFRHGAAAAAVAAADRAVMDHDV